MRDELGDGQTTCGLLFNGLSCDMCNNLGMHREHILAIPTQMMIAGDFNFLWSQLQNYIGVKCRSNACPRPVRITW